MNGLSQAIMPLSNGRNYVFINKQSGTALDLDTGNDTTVQGWDRHGGPNQQVRFTKKIPLLFHSDPPMFVVASSYERVNHKLGVQEYQVEQFPELPGLSCGWTEGCMPARSPRLDCDGGG